MSEAFERGNVEALPEELAAAVRDARGESPSEAEIARIEARVLAAIADGGAAAARAASEGAQEASAAGTPVAGGGVLAATLLGLAVLGVAWWNYDLGQPRLERAREVREMVEARSRGADAGADDRDAASPAPSGEPRAVAPASPTTE
jgi:hypothetical protein